MSGADKFKLAGEPFSVTLYGCTNATPIKSGPNYSAYFPIELTGTVKSSELETPYTIKPTSTTLILVEPPTGSDFVQMEGTLDIFGSSILVHAYAALPAGTLTSTSIGTFPSVSLVSSQSAFVYSQGTDSTTLSMYGTAEGVIYTGTTVKSGVQLHSNAIRVITANPDGTESERPLSAAPLDLGAPSGTVILRFYAHGVRDASQVQVRIAGQEVPVIYAGAAGHFPGLDEVTVEVPRSLAGTGDADVILTADGQAASPVHIQIQ